jgi:sec-independent protein translocase protein TatA
MGGFSILHLILVLVIVLVFFGPSRLPGLGKSLGEAIRGFKKGIEGDEIDVTGRDKIAPPNTQSVADKDKPPGHT